MHPETTPLQLLLDAAQDPLSRLQLKIAQRADELARAIPTRGGRGADLMVWRRAEAEFLRPPGPGWFGG